MHFKMRDAKFRILSEMQPPKGLSAPKMIMLYSTKMFAIFVAKIWFHSLHESSPKGVQTCLGIETPHIVPHKEAHKYCKDVKFPMMSGMRFNWLPERYLHPNIHTRVGFGVKFNVHHIKYALQSPLYFREKTHVHLCG